MEPMDKKTSLASLLAAVSISWKQLLLVLDDLLAFTGNFLRFPICE